MFRTTFVLKLKNHIFFNQETFHKDFFFSATGQKVELIVNFDSTSNVNHFYETREKKYHGVGHTTILYDILIRNIDGNPDILPFTICGEKIPK